MSHLRFPLISPFTFYFLSFFFGGGRGQICISSADSVVVGQLLFFNSRPVNSFCFDDDEQISHPAISNNTYLLISKTAASVPPLFRILRSDATVTLRNSSFGFGFAERGVSFSAWTVPQLCFWLGTGARGRCYFLSASSLGGPARQLLCPPQVLRPKGRALLCTRTPLCVDGVADSSLLSFFFL